MPLSRVLLVLGTVLAAVACLLSFLLWGDDAVVDLGLVLSTGFAGATCIGASQLVR